MVQQKCIALYVITTFAVLNQF